MAHPFLSLTESEVLDRLSRVHNNKYKPKTSFSYELLLTCSVIFDDEKILIIKQAECGDDWRPPTGMWHRDFNDSIPGCASRVVEQIVNVVGYSHTGIPASSLIPRQPHVITSTIPAGFQIKLPDGSIILGEKCYALAAVWQMRFKSLIPKNWEWCDGARWITKHDLVEEFYGFYEAVRPLLEIVFQNTKQPKPEDMCVLPGLE